LAKEVRLPQLGQTMEEGTVVSCKVKTGNKIDKGDVIFEIETDKATLEMESPLDGFVKVMLVNEGQTLPVGAPMLILGTQDEQISQSFIDSLAGGAAPVTTTTPTTQADAAEAIVESKTEAAKPQGKIIASPRAKKLAEELNVDISAVTGSGPGGKITEQDVKNAAQAGQKTVFAPSAPSIAEPKLGQTIPLNRLQKITAERMLKSKREIPCFYLTVRADVTGLTELRAKLNETADLKIAYNDFLIRAVAMGLEKYPIMTGQLAGENIQLADQINIGLAISVPDGLVAPLVKDANKNNIYQIAAQTKNLIDKARNNKLAPSDLEGGCCTISNLGAFGIENFIPICVPGQCSILGVGQITDTVVPGDGGWFVKKLMCMTLSVDHKVANGAYAAQFLDFVRKLLEDGSTLV
jgi:pyruvate dehydrogenase E2 component (dihydrolipoamide acetyltransferase)